MANSPQKRKNSEMTPEETSTSRSGRIRKPKVFYDPSIVKNDTKRRSMPNMESTKGKKPKIEEQEQVAEIKKIEKVAAKENATKRDPNPSAINKRRRTICASSFALCDDGSGCIVCGRSDIKKGRFVNCIGCDKRGHFTCLRNDKLYKTIDQEHNWQCPDCKICEYCRKVKPNEQLYKCINCSKSYHLHCSSKISPLMKPLVKKQFTCGKCIKEMSVANRSEASETLKPLKMLLPNRKSDGFPGFARIDESVKVESKEQKSLSFPSIKVKRKTSTTPVRRLSACKSTEATQILNDWKLPTIEQPTADLNVKQEAPSPDPDAAGHVIGTDSESFEDQSKSKIITVRKDLVGQPNTETDTKNTENFDKMEIEYDTKTAIVPHDSVPDVRKWDVDEVYTYFMGKTTPEYAQLLKHNQIDGDALLLIKREDVLNRFDLKLGPALRLYSHIVSLQYKNNNPILAWNEF